jgi:hypothetical protein
MNYIKQLNEFYTRLETEPLSANAISLYCALLQVNNKCAWSRSFKAANVVLQSKSGLNLSSLQRARNELAAAELIIYKKGKNKKIASEYSLPVLYEQVNEQQNGSQNDKQTNSKANSKPNSETNSETTTLNKQNKTKQNNKRDTDVSPKDDAIGPSKINYQGLMEQWNSNCHLKNICSMSNKRKSMLSARIKEHGEDSFETVINNINASKFMKGQNDKGWIADFDWLIKPNNYLKTFEGKYKEIFTNTKKAGKNFTLERDTDYSNLENDIVEDFLNEFVEG